MRELLMMAGVAFLITLVLTPIIRDIFRSYQVLDQPGGRKVHRYPIPRVGGIPIAVAYTAVLYLFSGDPGHLSPFAVKLVPGAALVFLIGLVDDFFNLRPVTKLLGQVAAAGLVYAGGLRVETVAGMDLPVWLSLLLTIFWLLLCTNALNLIDGLDGLCAGMGLFATLTLFAAAWLQGNEALAYATFPLAGALTGFLFYNFNPATVFLGDSGALLIGFLLGCYGMAWTTKTATILSMLVPLLALSVPLVDVSLAVLRRFLRNRPIFSADRGHIHHKLLDQGFSPRRAVLVLYLVASLAAAFALLLSYPKIGPLHGFVIVAFCGAAYVGIRQLRYAEFQMVRVFFQGEWQRSVDERMRLDHLKRDLEATAAEPEWWDVLVRFARESNLTRVAWSGASRRELALDPQAGGWRFQILLDGEHYVELEGVSTPGAGLDLARICEEIQTSAAAKAAQWNEARAGAPVRAPELSAQPAPKGNA